MLYDLFFSKRTNIKFYNRLRAFCFGKRVYSIILPGQKERFFFASSLEQAKSKFTGHEKDVKKIK